MDSTIKQIFAEKLIQCTTKRTSYTKIKINLPTLKNDIKSIKQILDKDEYIFSYFVGKRDGMHLLFNIRKPYFHGLKVKNSTFSTADKDTIAFVYIPFGGGAAFISLNNSKIYDYIFFDDDYRKYKGEFVIDDKWWIKNAPLFGVDSLCVVLKEGDIDKRKKYFFNFLKDISKILLDGIRIKSFFFLKEKKVLSILSKIREINKYKKIYQDQPVIMPNEYALVLSPKDISVNGLKKEYSSYMLKVYKNTTDGIITLDKNFFDKESLFLSFSIDPQSGKNLENVVFSIIQLSNIVRAIDKILGKEFSENYIQTMFFGDLTEINVNPIVKTNINIKQNKLIIEPCNIETYANGEYFLKETPYRKSIHFTKMVKDVNPFAINTVDKIKTFSCSFTLKDKINYSITLLKSSLFSIDLFNNKIVIENNKEVKEIPYQFDTDKVYNLDFMLDENKVDLYINNTKVETIFFNKKIILDKVLGERQDIIKRISDIESVSDIFLSSKTIQLFITDKTFGFKPDIYMKSSNVKVIKKSNKSCLIIDTDNNIYKNNYLKIGESQPWLEYKNLLWELKFEPGVNFKTEEQLLLSYPTAISDEYIKVFITKKGKLKIVNDALDEVIFSSDEVKKDIINTLSFNVGVINKSLEIKLNGNIVYLVKDHIDYRPNSSLSLFGDNRIKLDNNIKSFDGYIYDFIIYNINSDFYSFKSSVSEDKILSVLIPQNKKHENIYLSKNTKINNNNVFIKDGAFLEIKESVDRLEQLHIVFNGIGTLGCGNIYNQLGGYFYITKDGELLFKNSVKTFVKSNYRCNLTYPNILCIDYKNNRFKLNNNEWEKIPTRILASDNQSIFIGTIIDEFTKRQIDNPFIGYIYFLAGLKDIEEYPEVFLFSDKKNVYIENKTNIEIFDYAFLNYSKIIKENLEQKKVSFLSPLSAQVVFKDIKVETLKKEYDKIIKMLSNRVGIYIDVYNTLGKKIIIIRKTPAFNADLFIKNYTLIINVLALYAKFNKCYYIMSDIFLPYINEYGIACILDIKNLDEMDTINIKNFIKDNNVSGYLACDEYEINEKSKSIIIHNLTAVKKD